ncbi:COG4648 family protein [Caballeronia hypogeia]
MMQPQTARAAAARARGRTGVFVTVALKLAYPAVILGAWFWNAPRYAGCLLFALIWLQRCVGTGVVGVSLRRLTRVDWSVAFVLSAASAAIVWTDSERLLHVYPSLVNVGLLVAFGATLVRGPSMIEKFARIGTPDLSEAAVRHTRRVTQIWCAFFAANGLFSFYTALYWSREAWSLYNGAISYGLVGALIVGEIAWRHLVILPRARRMESA